MTNILTPLAASLLPLGLAAWSAAALAGGDLPADGDLPACEIRIEKHGGGLVLEGLAYAPVPTSGVYRMRISQNGSAGSSDISQSGEFETDTASGTSLGMVTLPRGSYVAELTVEWDDGAPDCTAEAGTAHKRAAK
jgi:hypothetical protein